MLVPAIWPTPNTELALSNNIVQHEIKISLALDGPRILTRAMCPHVACGFIDVNLFRGQVAGRASNATLAALFVSFPAVIFGQIHATVPSLLVCLPCGFLFGSDGFHAQPEPGSDPLGSEPGPRVLVDLGSVVWQSDK